MSPQVSERLLKREDAILAIIDIQEKLFPVMADREALAGNAVRLAKFAGIIGLPVVVTEQENLGPTLPEIASEIDGLTPITKITFDCFGNEDFKRRLEEAGRKTLVLCGIESHICVTQTALSGLADFDVQIVADAVSSRSLHNREVALKRLSQAGAVVTSTEMLIYELLGRAGTDEFRATLKLVK